MNRTPTCTENAENYHLPIFFTEKISISEILKGNVWQQSEFYDDVDLKIQIISYLKKYIYLRQIYEFMIFINLLKIKSE